MRSILQEHKECYICHCTNVEDHHIFGAFNRKNSEKYGLKVWLCAEHHRGNNGAHSGGALADYLHARGQAAFMERYPSMDFLQIFGRNYLC